MNPRDAARALHVGRIAIGTAMLVAPRLAAGGWIGARNVNPAATVLVRGFGARDAVLGALALHTLDNEQVGPRYLAATAAVDAVDAVAAVAVLSHLPRGRGLMGLAVAGGAAAGGAALSRALKQPQG